MTRARAARLAIAAFLLAAAPSRATWTDVRVVPGAGDGAERVEAVLPGRLVDWAAPRGGGGGRSLLMLAAEADEPEAPPTEGAPACPGPDAKPPADEPRLRLLQLDLASGTLRTMADGIPAGCGRLLSADPDGDGAEEALIVCDGGLYAPGAASGSLIPVIEDPDIDPRGMLVNFEGSASATAGIVPLQMLGEARFYRRDQDGSWKLLASMALPIRVSRSEGELRLETASLKPVGRPSPSRVLFAFGPQPHGASRLRTILLEPAVAGPAGRLEVWSRLPQPEIPLASTYALLDGHPALIVASRSAEKLSFFGEQRLRLFLLDEKDRSRTGTPPLLAAESHANLWQTMFPRIVDLDGDGRQDLVTAYWKGLKDTRVVLDAWMRRPDGTFMTRPAATEFDVPKANRGVLSYGDDIDGDGLGDLAVHAGGHLSVFRGIRPGADGRGLVETRPRWSLAAQVPKEDVDFDFGFSMDEDKGGIEITANPASRAIVPLDLDGDGRLEIVIPRGEPGVFVVVRLSQR